jgi:hypothetical protein
MMDRLLPAGLVAVISMTSLLAQQPATESPKPEPQTTQQPPAEQPKAAPEQRGVTPQMNDARRKELLRRFMQRFNERQSTPPRLFIAPRGGGVPAVRPRRIIVPGNLPPSNCSIPLLAVPPADPNATIVQVPVPDPNSKMPLVDVPAPPCEPRQP